ncbi:MAG TPA: GntR family transcriptional regulator, partial [Candidatus Saccharimonadales bacterium]|nr:GntR family transcriptional regulator [Candidatus Saccharimonadales bacterium]
MQTPVTRQFDATRGGRDVLLELELRRGHLRRNLWCALREAIQDGRLADGVRLPSSRQLAADLRVSRGVVADTYDQLVAEGYLEMAPRQAPQVKAVAAPA